ncbi:MLP-like protein 34 [Senna tora]|uniref:MLP-like protein 34 n=1 Tax=Senna tora TaxID=362788 RepID=A0A834W3Z8_9FABA|nr:MLP-like protein 34 [Senna tora]
MAMKGKVGAETEIRSCASKFFNLVVTQLHQVQNMTDVIHQTKLHQGDDWHGVGSHSVKHWTFSSGGKVVDCKEHIEEIDNANKTVLFKLFDGDFGEDKYKSVKLKFKVVENGEGDIVKWTLKFEKVHEAIPPPLDQLDSLIKATKEVDAFLLKA